MAKQSKQFSVFPAMEPMPKWIRVLHQSNPSRMGIEFGLAAKCTDGWVALHVQNLNIGFDTAFLNMERRELLSSLYDAILKEIATLELEKE